MATDDDGSSTTSGPVSVTVQTGNRAPTISLASPQSSEIQIAPGIVSLQATAADPDGAVAEVEFFSGSASVGVSATSPYQVTLNDLPPGTYSFTAMVTDDLGAQTMSPALTVNIVEQPTLQITPTGASSDQLSVSGTSGVPHILEVSSDFKIWTAIATNTPVAGEVTFTDLRRQSNQFYRVTVRP